MLSQQSMPTYEEAKQSPNLRAAHLQSLEQALPYHIKDLTYSDIPIGFQFYLSSLLKEGAIDETLFVSSSQAKRDDIMFLTFTPPSQYGKGIPQKVFVNPLAFELLNQEEFLSGLYDHESVHTLDGFHGIPYGNGKIDHTNILQLQPNTVLSVKETRAHLNELEQLLEKGMRKSMSFSNALRGANLYAGLLVSIHPTNNFEDEVRMKYLISARNRLTTIIKGHKTIQET